MGFEARLKITDTAALEQLWNAQLRYGYCRVRTPEGILPRTRGRVLIEVQEKPPLSLSVEALGVEAVASTLRLTQDLAIIQRTFVALGARDTQLRPIRDGSSTESTPAIAAPAGSGAPPSEDPPPRSKPSGSNTGRFKFRPKRVRHMDHSGEYPSVAEPSPSRSEQVDQIAPQPPEGEPDAESSLSFPPALDAEGPQAVSAEGSQPQPSRSAETSSRLQALSRTPGPSRTETEGLLPQPTDSGDFGKIPCRDVLLRLYAHQSTGILVVHGFREMQWCYLVSGQPVDFRKDRSSPGEFLGDSLIAAGAVTQEDWADALRMNRLTGVLAGDWLVRCGKISAEQLQAALTRRATRITRALLGTNFGSWSFHPIDELRLAFTNEPVDVLGQLMEAERRTLARMDDAKLLAEAESLFPLHVEAAPLGLRVAGMLGLSEDERNLVEDYLPAGWTLKELLGLARMEELKLYRFLFVMRNMGFIRLIEDEGDRKLRNRAERILTLGLRDLRRRDPFVALHSHWSGTGEELERGYKKVLRELGPERFPGVDDERVRRLIEEVRRVAGELWGQMGTQDTRRKVRARFAEESQLVMAADLLEKQAQMAAFKQEYSLAKACYQRIIELAPEGHLGAELSLRSKQALREPVLRDTVLPEDDAARERLMRKMAAAIGA